MRSLLPESHDHATQRGPGSGRNRCDKSVSQSTKASAVRSVGCSLRLKLLGDLLDLNLLIFSQTIGSNSLTGHVSKMRNAGQYFGIDPRSIVLSEVGLSPDYDILRTINPNVKRRTIT